MREIKFRAWVKDSKSMIEDVLPIHNEVYRLYCRDFEQDTDRYQNLGSAEIMQYTGLKDKNGKEIYEGDIVRCPLKHNEHLNYEVVFDYGSFTGVRHLDGYDVKVVTASMMSIMGEVIGNIHDNPELLENR